MIGPRAGIVHNIQTYDRSTGDFNVGNRGFFAGNYELPKAPLGRALNEAINGWQVNGTIVWQSGLPYTVTNLNNVSGILGISGERPNRVQKNTTLGQLAPFPPCLR